LEEDEKNTRKNKTKTQFSRT